ncbi:MAG: AAA family ATPase [Promethearchaeota archaeon]|nr:MAG: AAA family ATPase [Candidatus Lokiarchaeota archaeon]
MSQESPIWRIKYLPKNLDQICGRKRIIERLQQIIKDRNFPHLLFIGPEGIGKTTIARLFSKEFLGRFFDANFKIIYADERLTEEERKQARSDAYVSTSKIGSIAGKRITTPAFIQVKVKPFVQLKVIGDAPFKILVVKNFDYLGDEQQGFRRLMETYGGNCRMILITTKISGIIDPIISRCQLFLIPPVEYEPFRDLILKIKEAESLEITEETIKILYDLAESQIFRAIDLMQLCAQSSSSITPEKLYENAQLQQNNLMKSLLMICFKGDFKKSRDLSRKILSNNKYSAQEFFFHLLNEIHKLPLSRVAKIKLIEMLAEADFRALDGRDDDIQVSAFLSKLCLFAENL